MRLQSDDVPNSRGSGFFDLCLKIYFKNVHPRFPDGGPLSQYLNAMEIGAEIECRGPTGSHTYRGNGIITKENTKSGEVKETRTAKHLGMIAGGTGITPMLQIIRHVLRDPLEKTQMKLLFANQTEDDILLREELEQCAKDDRYPPPPPAAPTTTKMHAAHNSHPP